MRTARAPVVACGMKKLRLSQSQSRAFPGEPQTPNKLVPDRIPVLIPEQHPEVPASGIRQGWSSWKGFGVITCRRGGIHTPHAPKTSQRSIPNHPKGVILSHRCPPAERRGKSWAHSSRKKREKLGSSWQKEEGKAGLIPARRVVPWEHTIPFKSALSLLLPTPRPHPRVFLIPIS